MPRAPARSPGKSQDPLLRVTSPVRLPGPRPPPAVRSAPPRPPALTEADSAPHASGVAGAGPSPAGSAIRSSSRGTAGRGPAQSRLSRPGSAAGPPAGRRGHAQGRPPPTTQGSPPTAQLVNEWSRKLGLTLRAAEQAFNPVQTADARNTASRNPRGKPERCAKPGKAPEAQALALHTNT